MKAVSHVSSKKSSNVSLSTKKNNFVKKTLEINNSNDKSNNNLKDNTNRNNYLRTKIQNEQSELEKNDNSNINSNTTILKLRRCSGNPNFYSLPSMGFRRTNEPGTKPLINSDTFSQTKTFLYSDHQISPNNYCQIQFRNANPLEFPSNSMDSLNSSNDPEIVAALDQIASRMGLIDEKVLQTSDDPVNYLLKTRSFSEKLSIHKSSPIASIKGRRVQSLLNNAKSNLSKIDIKNESPSPSTPLMHETPVLRKKENSFKKMIQRLSPKGLRRTKSTPPTILKDSYFDRSVDKQNIIGNNINEKLEIIDATTSDNHNKLSDKSSGQQISNNISEEKVKDLCNISVQSKRLIQSISIDRVEDPKTTFLNISKNRLSQRITQDSDQEIPKSLQLETSNQGIQLQSNLSFDKPMSVTPSSANYIRISLSAFGYGPNPLLCRSMNSRRYKDAIKNVQPNIPVMNASGDKYCSDEDQTDQKK